MIKELTELGVEEAEDVLSEVASSLLPNPTDTHAESGQSKDSRTARAISAVAKYISEQGPKARVEVLNYVSDRLTSPYLNEQNIPEIKNRLAERGDLATGQYDIEYNPNLKLLGECTAVRQQDIKDTLYHPDRVEFLLPSRFGLSESKLPRLSLFLKRHRVHTAEAHSILVQCVSEGAKMNVWHAWRVYDRDVSITGDQSPLESLRAFIETYGVNLTIEGIIQTKKLIMYETFSAKRLGQVEVSFQNWGEMIMQTGLAKMGPLGSTEVAFAYGIRLHLYVRALARHGLRVDQSGQVLAALSGRGTVKRLLSEGVQ